MTEVLAEGEHAYVAPELRDEATLRHALEFYKVDVSADATHEDLIAATITAEVQFLAESDTESEGSKKSSNDEDFVATQPSHPTGIPGFALAAEPRLA